MGIEETALQMSAPIETQIPERHYGKFSVFHLEDMPSMASHVDQSACGFSLYRGIIVRWDEDEDSRIFTFIDQLPDNVREALLVVQEHEAAVSCVWAGAAPQGWNGREDIEVGGDVWWIIESLEISKKTLKNE